MTLKKGDPVEYILFGKIKRGIYVQQDATNSGIAKVIDSINRLSWLCETKDIKPLAKMAEDNPNLTFREDKGRGITCINL